jgi:NAD(P)-dependent dehydrogenase (short-subunit alcohol dehydrogenase family)
MSTENPSRVWLITGCSTGFGRALAERILAGGHRLIATARQPNQLADLGARFPTTCRVLTLDVTNPAQVKSVVVEAAAAFGQLDVVVNNAGYGLIGALEECDDEQIWRNFNTNLFGALRVIRAALPILRAQKRGHIINLSAAAAISNYAGFAVYGGAKWALEGVSEALALELRPLGIKVTLVQPGPFRTDFISRSLDRSSQPIADYAASSGQFAAFLEKVNGSQPGDPDKAADAIIRITEAERPPLRLVLGKYANDKVLKNLDARRRELEAWKELGLPTDFA